MEGMIMSRTRSEDGLETVVFFRHDGAFMLGRLLNEDGDPWPYEAFADGAELIDEGWMPRRMMSFGGFRHLRGRKSHPEDIFVDASQVHLLDRFAPRAEFHDLVGRYAAHNFEQLFTAVRWEVDRSAFVMSTVKQRTSFGFIYCTHATMQPNRRVLLATGGPALLAPIIGESLLRRLESGEIRCDEHLHHITAAVELDDASTNGGKSLFPRHYINCVDILPP